ncbi:phosducin [Geosmithia morbida]|uniref:Phosducin n=1 Tax=Geosmithia morbida TaxID=1094350 RepID=A0A9P4YMN0_9HYPO|nr:phosducin [Geosmithia morbida]KAF4119766.1 phosducin [Geosmithia morbida]
MTATSTTPAQDEFNALLGNNASSNGSKTHPEDSRRSRSGSRGGSDDDSSLSEEEEYRNAKVEAAMHTNTNTNPGALNLPPASFDNGRSTGVKGVIADARSYEAAKKSKWRSRVSNARRSIFGGMDAFTASSNSNTVTAAARRRGPGGGSDSDGGNNSNTDVGSDDDDDDSFLRQWRESRRRELEAEAGRAVRTRRTSPSVREYGRLDEVDAMGYLDAIEKVGRDTTVVVFVYDHEVSRSILAPFFPLPRCEVSATIESAMMPLVKTHRAVHFVKVHYDDIEFDPAATPSVLAYRNQGDLVSNLTGLIEMIPDDDYFGTDSLFRIFQQNGVL